MQAFMQFMYLKSESFNLNFKGLKTQMKIKNIDFVSYATKTIWYSFTSPPPKKKVKEKVHNKAK